MYEIEDLRLQVNQASLLFMAIDSYRNLKRTRILITDSPKVTVTTSRTREGKYETTVEIWAKVNNHQGWFGAIMSHNWDWRSVPEEENRKVKRTLYHWWDYDLMLTRMKEYETEDEAMQGHDEVVQGVREQGMEFTENGILSKPVRLPRFII